jgi:N-acetylglucosaminyldiphosphoundecaprenol N-acetyl-beta-D-mannosaminyltransferase
MTVRRAAAVAARRSTARWAGVRLSTYDREGIVDAVTAALAAGEKLMVSYLNPFYARATAGDARLAEVVDGFDIVQPDGWGVVYGARAAGIAVPQRAAIEDFERPLFEWMAEHGHSVFLFGSEPGIAEEAGRTLRTSFPGLVVAGTQHGWLDVEAGHPGVFDDADAERVAAAVESSGAGLVLVGLPTPLQQDWAARYGPGLSAPVVMTAGAYFDKLAEKLDWYPRWMESARLGWAYRVWREPRRLLPRYTVGAGAFALVVLRETVAARRDRRWPGGRL